MVWWQVGLFRPAGQIEVGSDEQKVLAPCMPCVDSYKLPRTRLIERRLEGGESSVVGMPFPKNKFADEEQEILLIKI